MAKPENMSTEKPMHGKTIMKDTRQKSGGMGAAKIGGEPASSVRKGGGTQSTRGMMGLKIGTRVTSRETRKR